MNIRWQCRRGMLELDIIFERFLQNHYDRLTPEEKIQFSDLLKQDDPVLYDWLVSDLPCTDESLKAIVAIVKSAQFPEVH